MVALRPQTRASDLFGLGGGRRTAEDDSIYYRIVWYSFSVKTFYDVVDITLRLIFGVKECPYL